MMKMANYKLWILYYDKNIDRIIQSGDGPLILCEKISVQEN